MKKSGRGSINTPWQHRFGFPITLTPTALTRGSIVRSSKKEPLLPSLTYLLSVLCKWMGVGGGAVRGVGGGYPACEDALF